MVLGSFFSLKFYTTNFKILNQKFSKINKSSILQQGSRGENSVQTISKRADLYLRGVNESHLV